MSNLATGSPRRKTDWKIKRNKIDVGRKERHGILSELIFFKCQSEATD